MKKFLGILAIAGVLVACNNAADSEQRTKDSLDSVAKADSLARLAAPSLPDTTTVVVPADTTTVVVGDTSKAGVDTTKIK